MTLFHLPFTAAPNTDPGAVPTPADPRVIARFDAVDDRLATMDERLDLFLDRTHGVLTEVQALGRRVEAIVADNAAAAAERAR